MDHSQEVYNTIYQSTYCFGAITKPLYLLFLKGLVEKYLLDHQANYHIYISTDDKILPLYQKVLTSNPRLIYISDEFVPTAVPNNINSIYIYHKQTKPSDNEQFALISFMESHSTFKYIFAGNTKLLLPYVRIKLFKYYLHFEIRNSRWGHMNTNLINHSIYRSVCKKYYTQRSKKIKAVNPITLVDYFFLHDMQSNQTKTLTFNVRKFTPKKKKITALPPKTSIQSTAAKINDGEPIVNIKYIYTGPYNSPSCLIMPDGSKENFNGIVQKYCDVIEI